MSQPSKGMPIDPNGRLLLSDAAEVQIATASITVGTTAVTVTTSLSPPVNRRKLFIRNTKLGTEIVAYIGDANVTASTGFPLYQLDEIELDVDSDTVVKVIRASTGTTDGEIRILEIE